MVDDSAPVRTMITTCVSVGVPGVHKILEAENAVQAIHEWRERNGNVDLIITELSFITGAMRGQAMIDFIRMSDPDVPIIVAAVMDEEDIRISVRGANAVFPKPFGIAGLMAAVRRSLLSVERAPK
ncbi:MAG: response regulator [bacterium]|nr:response regulator [bacterium]